jgi:hypothetical protein
MEQNDKWNRGLDLFIESAHNQECYDELMQVRDHVLEYLKTIRK